MLPELGYPQGWTHASSWETNWGTHYGTHITGVHTGSFPRGRLTLFVDSPPARAATAEVACDKASRSRTIVLVDVSDDDCYALSLERVRGGKEHRWSFHGPDGEAAASNVELTPRGGTVLGEDVPYGDTSNLPGGDGELACLAFMYDPQTAQPRDLWALDYLLRDQGDVHLRMTMVHPNDAELTVAKGKAPGGKSDYEMTWAILRREGAEPLSSQYLCVLEPYQGKRIVQKIEQVAVVGDGLAVRVTTDEYVDTIVLREDASSTCKTADGLVCDGEFGFWREKNGELVTALASDTAYTGIIESCDYENFEMKIAPAPGDTANLIGKHLHIHNEAGNGASYLIKNARAVKGGCVLTLDLDPRIGEGFVSGFEDGCLISGTHLRMAQFSYYAGKTLANEDQSAMYRLKDVENGKRCMIDEATHGKGALSEQFSDRDGDGLSRFIIYDYGTGDKITIKSVAVLKEE
jgi:hypothetical protein